MAAEPLSFEVAIAAGGASRRMAADKAFISIDGATMIERIAAAALAAGAAEVKVVGGDAGRIEALGLRFVADEEPGAGPLGALVTALGCAARPAVLMLPCDLVAPTPAALREIAAALGGHDAAVPWVDGRLQWATAAWSTQALGALREAFDAGERSLRFALEGHRVQRFVPSDPAALADADTPDELPAGAEAAGVVPG